MREIKARIYCQHEDTGYITCHTISLGESFPSLSKRWFIIAKCQATGLKDKNGKEIYEGDILEYYSCMVAKGENIMKREEVKWNKRNVGFTGCFNGGNVIGNIYENKELLNAD